MPSDVHTLRTRPTDTHLGGQSAFLGIGLQGPTAAKIIRLHSIKCSPLKAIGEILQVIIKEAAVGIESHLRRSVTQGSLHGFDRCS